MRRFNALALLRRQTSSGSWIPELDGLRFIAIVSVIFFHIAGQIEHHHTAQISNHYAWMSRAFLNGYRGVQLFFMISGFGVPGSICASGGETDWNKLSGRWREARRKIARAAWINRPIWDRVPRWEILNYSRFVGYKLMVANSSGEL
jgi:peptidoglycan/LPS O-acetylase OafA/YrhL